MFEVRLNPHADWFSSVEAVINESDLRNLTAVQTTSGLQALESRMPAANAMHHAGEWLASTASGELGQNLAKQMIAASISADHYHARLICPRASWRRLRGAAWREYIYRRTAQTLEQFADVLLRWTVLQRIPTNWIESEVVFSQIRSALSRLGFSDVSIEGSLLSPFPAGTPWLRAECSSEKGTLERQSDGQVHAAVVFWPENTTAVVMVTAAGEPIACAPNWEDNLPIRWTGEHSIAGILLLPPPEDPPVGPLMAFWRVLRLDRCVWNSVRRWRRWRHR